MDAGAQIAVPAHGGDPSKRRRMRNYLLDTSLQLRLASYLLAVATAISVGLGWLLWSAYAETSRVVALADPELGESISTLLAREDRVRIIQVAASLAAVLLCLLGAAIVITHRIAGPAFAIGRTCRQVGEGDLSRPRSLRAHDLLVDLADDVATMVEGLRAREEVERDALARAARTLSDPGAAPEERAEAVAIVERVAGEKSRRLAT